MENLIEATVSDDVTRHYGKYTKKVNGVLVKVIYDWFERDSQNRYKFQITNTQFAQMNSCVAPVDAHGNPLEFNQFCDILIPVLMGEENETRDEYAIWLAFQSIDRNRDDFVEIEEFELFMTILGQSIDRERLRFFIDRVDTDRKGRLDYHKFRQFISRGYARELLRMDIARETV